MRTLIADDDPISRRLLEAMLAHWGYHVISCPDGETALETLRREEDVELIILDWMMPGLSGMQVCQAVRDMPGKPYAYILLLTARDRTEDLVVALEGGADDYLTKPYKPQELKARLHAGRRILDLQRELRAARDALHIQATRDPLTGLLNRRAIMETLDQELARAQREATALCIAMADVDRFKSINDTHGHQAGDAVLCETARLLQHTIRPYDAVGRYGGEEFLLVFPGCDAARGLQAGNRIRERMEQATFSSCDATLCATLSMGIAGLSGARDAMDAGTLLRTADAALYRAKQQGRNRVELGVWLGEPVGQR
jgi:diguanylate cyclase (GGDEF)-like protein